MFVRFHGIPGNIEEIHWWLTDLDDNLVWLCGGLLMRWFSSQVFGLVHREELGDRMDSETTQMKIVPNAVLNTCARTR